MTATTGVRTTRHEPFALCVEAGDCRLTFNNKCLKNNHKLFPQGADG